MNQPVGRVAGISRTSYLLVFLFLAGCVASTEIQPTAAITIDFPEKRSSSAITITSDGKILLVVNPDSNSLSLVDTQTLTLMDEISVGHDPRTVSVDAAGRIAAVANRMGGSITLVDLEQKQAISEIDVGALPWGVVLSFDGTLAYVACEEDDWVAVVDTSYRRVVDTIPVEDRPNGLAVARDGSTLFVTHLLSAKVSVIDLSNNEVVGLIPTWIDGNLSQSIVLHPLNQKAYLPLTRSNTTNSRLTFDTTVFPLVTVVDLSGKRMLTKEIISLPEADRPVGLPYDAAFLPDGSKLYIVNAASDDVSVINMETGRAAAHILVEDNPRGIVASPDGSRVYINNTLAGTVTVIDTQIDEVLENILVTEIPLPPVLLHGKRLFHSSRHPDLSRDGWISCNTCHWEGEQDGRTWSFSFAGPRNTTSLLGMIKTYPLRWSAEWDESADSNFAIVEEQFGTGLIEDGMHPALGDPNSGRSYDLDSLALFIDSLEFLPNYQEDGFASVVVRRGEELFFDELIGCSECHPPPYYTDFQTHDVGTASAADELLGPLIDTPTLLNLIRTAPYLHNGASSTLMELLTYSNFADQHGVTSHLSKLSLDALVAYMLSLN